MSFKVLCLTLIACTLVQAAPKPEGGLFDVGGLFDRTQAAISKVYSENTEILQNKVTNLRKVVEEGANAAAAVVKADVDLLATPVRYGIKFVKKGVDLTDISDIKRQTGEALSEIMQENHAILTDKVQKVSDAAAGGYEAAVKNFKDNILIVNTPVRIASEVFNPKTPDYTGGEEFDK
ncbi:uncharacterized protein LOC135172925 [Diachasmimorpha longicaudata]|uniref:uncharacterized protein LOC135172925 n=1 Tax=Diachasmimorpha longicaudata TaxID=58733 RepID=UPI0030B878D4